jgi:hypothetical protein
MLEISEKEFARICEGIYQDRESIRKHNPNGTPEETLLWMLLGCLIGYLSLSEIETPCFSGKPDAETYRNAILFVLKNRKAENFDAEIYLKKLTESEQIKN